MYQISKQGSGDLIVCVCVLVKYFESGGRPVSVCCA